jgi:hypothetical protein
MPAFRTDLERRLWVAAGSLVLAIYASAYFVQFLLDALRGRGILGGVVGSVFIVVAAAAAAFVVRQRPGRWEVALLAAAAGCYLLLLRHLTIVQERIHLLLYGALGGLCYAALLERCSVDGSPPTASAWPRWQRWPAAWAVLLAGLAGWGDELVQAVLPNRVYDLRDVLTNAEAAALLVLVLAARRRLRHEAAARVASPV